MRVKNLFNKQSFFFNPKGNHLIVGENGTGKSKFLEALRRPDDIDTFEIDNTIDMNLNNGGEKVEFVESTSNYSYLGLSKLVHQFYRHKLCDGDVYDKVLDVLKSFPRLKDVLEQEIDWRYDEYDASSGQKEIIRIIVSSALLILDSKSEGSHIHLLFDGLGSQLSSSNAEKLPEALLDVIEFLDYLYPELPKTNISVVTYNEKIQMFFLTQKGFNLVRM